MTSGPHSYPLPQPMRHADQPPAPPLRLRLKPKGSLNGYVDGGWWPRSRDLVIEVPALARVLGVRLGRVTGVDFAAAAWDVPPRTITVDGHPVALEAFGSPDEHVVHVSGPDGRRLVLLVVPPDTGAGASHEAMLRSAHRDDVDQPGDILTAAGALRRTPPTLRLIRGESG